MKLWQQSSHPQRRSDITFTLVSYDDLTQSLYQCQTLYKAAFNQKMHIQDRQAIVCGRLPNISDPVCACRLTMTKTVREFADDYDSYLMHDGETTDDTSQGTNLQTISIDNFAVHPSYHRGRIGTALMYHIKKWALHRLHGNMKRLRLHEEAAAHDPGLDRL